MLPARIAGLILLLMPVAAWATDDAAYCNAAAAQVARTKGMPVDVLRALTLVETGRKRGGRFQPWPWTVNMEGKGYWFDTRVEALAFVEESYANGARSFDIGCFQINHRWHGQAFTSFDQMFEPLDNATYAAKFMTDLFNEGGTWSWAAGAYHSRTESLASKYRDRFDRIMANLTGEPMPELPVVLASANVVQPVPAQVAERISTWGPFAPNNLPAAPVRNGSLAGGLMSSSALPLLTKSAGALF